MGKKKVEVILTKPVPKLGAEADRVAVAPGYARNYLIPMGLAIPVTEASERRLEALRKRRAEREAQELKSMQELAATLRRAVLRIGVRIGEEGKMFGAVTALTIAEELKKQWDVDLDHRKIDVLHPIRTLGEHEIQVYLHPKVRGKLRILVEAVNLPQPGAQQEQQEEGPKQES